MYKKIRENNLYHLLQKAKKLLGIGILIKEKMINSNITFVLLKKLTEQGISLGQHETEKLIYYVKGVTKSHLAFNS